MPDNKGNTGALVNLQLDPRAVLKRYLEGEKASAIAQGHGVTRAALTAWLVKTAEDDWKEAQVALALARLETAEEEMETAPDALALARARETWKAAAWRLERTCKRIFGTDTPPDLAGRVHININLGADRPIVDAQVIDDTGKGVA